MSRNVLDTGARLVKNVGRYYVGASSLKEMPALLGRLRGEATARSEPACAVFLVDHFFRNAPGLAARLGAEAIDRIEFVDTTDEPTTDAIDALVARLIHGGFARPAAVIGMGGGVTMDTAKAVSNLLANGGKASEYQGWDLVKLPGIFKIGIPTISGTGAEATRTCVMTNPANGLKLGMNSDFTVFDHVIMDPELTATVPRDQYFYTGMDAYIHCVEALAGSYRNAIGDAYSRETINLCRQVFLGGDMQSPQNRERLMVASYLGGCAIATSYVGLIHPLSAALSVVLGIHHCVANCIVMEALEGYYPEAHAEFREMVACNGISIPQGVCAAVGEEGFRELYNASIMHEKPLTNALGENFREILSFETVTDIFRKM